MKATIDQHGTLVLTIETPIEAYAIDHWMRANFPSGGPVIADCSVFPPAILCQAPGTWRRLNLGEIG